MSCVFTDAFIYVFVWDSILLEVSFSLCDKEKEISGPLLEEELSV